MKNLKKILLSALILPCLFLFSGCLITTRINSAPILVDEITTSAESVETNATSVSNTEGPNVNSSQTSMRYDLGLNLEGFQQLTAKVTQKGATLSSATITLSGNLVILSSNIANLTINAESFYEVAPTLQITEEDIVALNKYYTELKDIAKEVEDFAQNTQAYSQNLQTTVNNLVAKISAGTFVVEDLDPMVAIFDDVIEFVNLANSKVVRVNAILQDVNAILEKYLAN